MREKEREKEREREGDAAYYTSGAPLIIHPGQDDRSPFEIISILESAGANIDRTVMSHLDTILQDETKLLEFAKLGCIMEYDLFGIECSHCQVPSRLQTASHCELVIVLAYYE